MIKNSQKSKVKLTKSEDQKDQKLKMKVTELIKWQKSKKSGPSTYLHATVPSAKKAFKKASTASS